MIKAHIKILIAILVVDSILCDFCFSQSNQLSIGKASGRIGSTNNILPISLSNQDTIAGLILTVNYNPNVLTPANITTVARTQNQSGLDFYIPTPGELKITMFDFNGYNIDPSSGEIIQVLFDVSNTAAAGVIPVSITEHALSNTTYQSMSVTVTNGVFEVISGPALAPPRNLTDQEIGDDVILNWDAPVTGKQSMNKREDFIHIQSLKSLEGKKQYGSTKNKVQTMDITAATILDEVEPNNTKDQAQVLSGESPLLLNGETEVDDFGVYVIVDMDDDIEDLFEINTTTQGLRITLDGFTSDCDVYLFNPEITQILGESNFIGATVPEEINMPDLPAGNYYIGVTIYDIDPMGADTSDYVLTVFGDFEENGSLTLQSYYIYRSISANAKNTGSKIGTLDASITTFKDALPNGGSHYYQVTALYDEGESWPSNEVTVLVASVEDEQSVTLPAAFALEQNYPNPFNPATRISFQLPEQVFVVIRIFNILSQEVRTLVERNCASGFHTVTWDGKDLTGNYVPAGLYFYRMEAGEFQDVKKMILIK